MNRDDSDVVDPERRCRANGAEGPIPVVAAVIRRRGRVLLCQRPEGPHLPLKWEFPGGKVDPGESPADALRRELREELGVDAKVGDEIERVRHAYPEKTVELHFFAVQIHDEPVARIHRRIRWVSLAELERYEVPPPNAVLLERLRAGRIPDTPGSGED